MKWLDGSELCPEEFTGESLCEKLALELFRYDYQNWLACPEFVQNAAFLIAFDTELAMEGIFGFLENSVGQYAPNIIQAFRTVGDNQDADILARICTLSEEETISQLENQLYLNTDFDIWNLLYQYLDKSLEKECFSDSLSE